jgi:predicted GNAT family acetyltransferase
VAGHIVLPSLWEANPALRDRMISLAREVKGEFGWDAIKRQPAYARLNEEQLAEEVWAFLLGYRGEQRLDDLLIRSGNNLFSVISIMAMIRDFWAKAKDFFNNVIGVSGVAIDNIETATVGEVTELADKILNDVFEGRYSKGLSEPGFSQDLQDLQDRISSAERETDTNPTEAQKKAGNYKMGHVKVQGFDITIENPKGSVRRGVDANGAAWETKMHNTYGYFGKTESKDGDHIDLFLGDNPLSKRVFVVDQINPETGAFDEHKVMFGFESIDEAKKAYLSNYEKGWKGLGNITETDVEAFRNWAVKKEGKRRKPFSQYITLGNNLDLSAGENAEHRIEAQRLETYLNETEEGKKITRQIAETRAKYTMPRTAKGIDEAIELFKKEGKGVVENTKLGLRAGITGKSLNKFRNLKEGEDARLHALAVANIDLLFENAEFDVTHTDKKERPEIEKVHRLGNLMFDEKTNTYVPVMITMFEYNDGHGNKVYSVEAVDIETEKNSAGQMSDGKSPHDPIAEFSTKIQQLYESAKEKEGNPRFQIDFAENKSVKNRDRQPIRTDEHGRNIVWENGDYEISFSHGSRRHYYIALWDKSTGKKVGELYASLENKDVPDGYLSVDNVKIDKKHRGKGLSKEMYQAVIDFSDEAVKGISSYLPDRINEKQVPRIWNRLGGTVEGDYQNVRFQISISPEGKAQVSAQGLRDKRDSGDNGGYKGKRDESDIRFRVDNGGSRDSRDERDGKDNTGGGDAIIEREAKIIDGQVAVSKIKPEMSRGTDGQSYIFEFDGKGDVHYIIGTGGNVLRGEDFEREKVAFISAKGEGEGANGLIGGGSAVTLEEKLQLLKGYSDYKKEEKRIEHYKNAALELPSIDIDSEAFKLANAFGAGIEALEASEQSIIESQKAAAARNKETQSDFERLMNEVKNKRKEREHQARIEETAQQVADYLNIVIGKDISQMIGERELKSLINKIQRATSRGSLKTAIKDANHIIQNVILRKNDDVIRGFLKGKILNIHLIRELASAVESSLGVSNKDYERLLSGMNAYNRYFEIQGKDKRGVQIYKNVDERTRRLVQFVRDNATTGKEYRDNIVSETKEYIDAQTARLLDKTLSESQRQEILDNISNEDWKFTAIKMVEMLESLEDKRAEIKLLHETPGEEFKTEHKYEAIYLAKQALEAIQADIIQEFGSIFNNGHSRLQAWVDAQQLRSKEQLLEALSAVTSKPVLTQAAEKERTAWRRGIDLIKTNKISEWLKSPLGSFNFMVKYIDVNHPFGEGGFYKRWLKSKEGVYFAELEADKGIKDFKIGLEKKIKEFFGEKMNLHKFAQDTREKSSLAFSYSEWSGDGLIHHENVPMSKGELLYIWLTWQHADGREKLEGKRKEDIPASNFYTGGMGITQSDINAIASSLGSAYGFIASNSTRDY